MNSVLVNFRTLPVVIALSTILAFMVIFAGSLLASTTYVPEPINEVKIGDPIKIIAPLSGCIDEDCPIVEFKCGSVEFPYGSTNSPDKTNLKTLTEFKLSTDGSVFRLEQVNKITNEMSGEMYVLSRIEKFKAFAKLVAKGAAIKLIIGKEKQKINNNGSFRSFAQKCLSEKTPIRLDHCKFGSAIYVDQIGDFKLIPRLVDGSGRTFTLKNEKDETLLIGIGDFSSSGRQFIHFQDAAEKGLFPIDICDESNLDNGCTQVPDFDGPAPKAIYLPGLNYNLNFWWKKGIPWEVGDVFIFKNCE